MSMKHPPRFHGKAAKNRRVKAAQLKAEKRALRQRLDEARQVQA